MSKLEPLVAKARQHRQDTLAKVSPPLPPLPQDLPLNVSKLPDELLTPREVELTNHDAVQLIELMSTKKVSCEEVTRAFLRRAALAQELVYVPTCDSPDYSDSRCRPIA